MRCRLRELRVRSGLTQLQLAARSGLSLGTIRKLEEGHLGSTRVRTLVAASHALGLAPVDVVPALDWGPAKARDWSPRARGGWARER